MSLQEYLHTTNTGFLKLGCKSRHVIQEIFTRETMKTRKSEMCLKQNLEAAKLCRVERQMTEEGIIFSIYTCLPLLFLHVLSPFCIRLDDVFRYEEKLFKLSWSFYSSFCHKVVPRTIIFRYAIKFHRWLYKYIG